MPKTLADLGSMLEGRRRDTIAGCVTLFCSYAHSLATLERIYDRTRTPATRRILRARLTVLQRRLEEVRGTIEACGGDPARARFVSVFAVAIAAHERELVAAGDARRAGDPICYRAAVASAAGFRRRIAEDAASMRRQHGRDVFSLEFELRRARALQAAVGGQQAAS